MKTLALRRTLGAALLSGAALTLTTFAATPAEAATVIKVRTVGTTMAVSGTLGGDALTFSGSGGTVTVTTNIAATVTGGSCTANTATKVTCTGVARVQAVTGDGNDSITNKAAVPLSSNGGAGSDTLVGGALNDTLNAGPGVDDVNGGGGRDTCGGVVNETFTSCEEVTS